jgi:hypothetical protein
MPAPLLSFASLLLTRIQHTEPFFLLLLLFIICFLSFKLYLVQSHIHQK